jgi:hypothetical protein
MHRWIDVTEVPLIGRDLAGRMLVGSGEQEVELLLGEIDVDGGERDRVEGKVPGGKPRVFPLVGHRDDMIADHVEPLAVPRHAGFREQRIGAPQSDDGSCSRTHS